MNRPIAQDEEIRPPGRSEARATGVLLVVGAGLVGLSLVLPHPDGGDTIALGATAVGMALLGILCWTFSARIGTLACHLLLAGVALVTGLLTWEAGLAVGQYGSIFVWVTVISAYFFSRRAAALHLAWLLLVYAGALALVEGTAGYSPVTRWIFSAITLTVLMLLISNISARRQRADTRARRFFDLSRDLLCTMDPEGYCVEVNAAWGRSLGYRGGEMRGTRLLDLTHPDDRAAGIKAARRIFSAGAPAEIETRVRAKDGSWHWLRTSAVFEPDEQLVYARSTDVTAQKALEREREELIAEVQMLARSDALTGLPNRRALDDLLPREMARAARSETPLWLALIDIDHFKAYNDNHGHLAGDTVLRDCAVAWDSVLRGEDSILRFGGEEFLVVLREVEAEIATAIVERLRAATPAGQTCSAGLALWRPGESVDKLIGRADAALYQAKESGRDRLVSAPTPDPETMPQWPTTTSDGASAPPAAIPRSRSSRASTPSSTPSASTPN
ncbi:MAG TPA: diguanylate cyclase [Solirubrobacterales bacterium]|nr:diguanylate cyclase [Solirubrobacterales bacterium]